MQNKWKPEQMNKCPDLHERYERSLQQVRNLPDQEVIDLYRNEMLKLKTLNRFGRTSERFQGYPNTAKMNRWKRELERRNLPVPQVQLSEEEK
jgi:hypothetical protein